MVLILISSVILKFHRQAQTQGKKEMNHTNCSSDIPIYLRTENNDTVAALLRYRGIL